MSHYDSDSHVSLDNSLYLLPFLAIVFFPEFFIWVLAIFAIVCWMGTMLFALVFALGFGLRVLVVLPSALIRLLRIDLVLNRMGGRGMTKYHWVVAFAALAMLLETGASYPIRQEYGLLVAIGWLVLSLAATMGVAVFFLIGRQKSGANCLG
jgi:hypothetical protein